MPKCAGLKLISEINIFMSRMPSRAFSFASNILPVRNPPTAAPYLFVYRSATRTLVSNGRRVVWQCRFRGVRAYLPRFTLYS